MQLITNISKLLVIAFSITCSVVLLWQYGPPIFPLTFNSPETSSEGIAIAQQATAATTVQAIKTHATKPVFMPVKLVHKINFDKLIKTVTVTTVTKQITQTVATKSATPATSTAAASDLIWVRIGDHLQMNHYADNPRVQKEIHRILGDKKSFQTILQRSAPYIYYIYKQTQARHLPAELALIPIIESEYNPNDHNSIGAMGLWQLMPATAKILGVKIGNGYDGRRNVIISTKAALAFYTDLGKFFNGNWILAIAAYNCGQGGVDAAIKRAGGSRDFFKLSVPQETRYYVPRLLAIATIIKHAHRYGIVLPNIKDAPYFTEVKMAKSESLSTYAKNSGVDLDVLKKLNPDYGNGKIVTVSKTLLVPVSSTVTPVTSKSI